MLCDEVSEVQHSQKFMEQVDSTEVRETRMVIGYSHARWRATHCKPHLTKSDVRLTLPQQPSDPHQNGLSGTFERSECAGFRYQHLAKRRVEGLDVFGEVLAILKVELLLAALL